MSAAPVISVIPLPRNCKLHDGCLMLINGTEKKTLTSKYNKLVIVGFRWYIYGCSLYTVFSTFLYI